jgi:hypothetical protein
VCHNVQENHADLGMNVEGLATTVENVIVLKKIG